MATEEESKMNLYVLRAMYYSSDYDTILLINEGVFDNQEIAIAHGERLLEDSNYRNFYITKFKLNEARDEVNI